MNRLPIPIDPRNALVRQVAHATAMGFDVLVGTELEFYLLDPVIKLPEKPRSMSAASTTLRNWTTFSA